MEKSGLTCIALGPVEACRVEADLKISRAPTHHPTGAALVLRKQVGCISTMAQQSPGCNHRVGCESLKEGTFVDSPHHKSNSQTNVPDNPQSPSRPIYELLYQALTLSK
jgi:hypothetical protein